MAGFHGRDMTMMAVVRQATTTSVTPTSTSSTTSATPKQTYAPGTDPTKPHDNLGTEANVAIWLLTGFSALFLALRVYAKRMRRRGLWWDDYVLILAWVVLFVSAIFQSVSVPLGLGLHFADLQPQNVVPFFYYSNIAGVLTIIAAALSKTSFAITLLRLCTGFAKKFIWFVIVSVNLILFIAILLQFLRCNPVAKVWNSNLPGTCWNRVYLVNYDVFTAAYSGTMDIVLALLPWKMIWGLTMNKKEKIGVLVAMSMGIFAGATSIWKIWGLLGFGGADNATLVNLEILATAESAITIIAASIPILRALIREKVSTNRTRQTLQFYKPSNAPPSNSETRSWPVSSQNDASRDELKNSSSRQNSRKNGSISRPYISSPMPQEPAHTRQYSQQKPYETETQQSNGRRGSFMSRMSRLALTQPSRKRGKSSIHDVNGSHEQLSSSEAIELPEDVNRKYAAPWEYQQHQEEFQQPRQHDEEAAWKRYSED